MLKTLLYAVLSLAVIVIALTIYGNYLPEKHSVSSIAILPIPPQRTWDLITHVGDQPTWRSDIKSINMLPVQDGHPCYTEVHKWTKLSFCLTQEQQPSLLVQTIADSNAPMQGSWTYQLRTTNGNHTELTITEDASVHNPFLRYLGYQFGLDTMIRQYQADLLKAASR